MTDAQLDTSVPQTARIWNYWLGGKDNFAVDRQVGDEIRQAFPPIVDNARASRAFRVRAVTHADPPYVLRGRDQFAGFFDGLELIEPGVTSAPLWRPGSGDAQSLDVVCGVGRKR